jgi:sterol desaturase/sphingolipid hydroxylase (fatty acid hydroxylase superfamily)
MHFNTPSHDRAHHASNREYLDRNYGGNLIIWDRLVGTFAQEQPQTKITYGLVHPVGSLNPVRIAFHEWGAVLRDLGPAQSGRPGDSLASLAESPCLKP